jgi:MFS family permease
MTLLYRVVPPHIYIASCVAAWGLTASVQCLSTSFSSLLVLRALLGISEAAFGPGVPFYLSFFYNREELALRTGLFISAAPLATSFASTLAWLIVKAGSYSSIAPWRLLFLIEGFPSLIVAYFAWMFIPDSPNTAQFLDAREKKVAELRLNNADSSRNRAVKNKHFQWKEIGRTLTDPKSYFTAVCCSCQSVA